MLGRSLTSPRTESDSNTRSSGVGGTFRTASASSSTTRPPTGGKGCSSGVGGTLRTASRCADDMTIITQCLAEPNTFRPSWGTFQAGLQISEDGFSEHANTACVHPVTASFICSLPLAHGKNDCESSLREEEPTCG